MIKKNNYTTEISIMQLYMKSFIAQRVKRHFDI